MKEIEVTADIDVPRSTVEAHLSPTAILEYADTYTVVSAADTASGEVVTVDYNDNEATFEFTRLPDGYEYTQVGSAGPFESMYTRLTIDGDAETRVTVFTTFTFGGTFSILKDWLGADLRRSELQRLLVNLEADLTGDETTTDQPNID
ncbi:MAG: hypothetical protein ACQETB_10125 [Halobacteriota archaeon]